MSVSHFRGNDRDKVYVRRIRRVLLHALGKKCSKCGTTKELEFDVIEPVFMDPKNHHGKMSQRQRCNFYCEQFIQNNLQILCEKHNSAKNDDHKCPLLL